MLLLDTVRVVNDMVYRDGSFLLTCSYGVFVMLPNLDIVAVDFTVALDTIDPARLTVVVHGVTFAIKIVLHSVLFVLNRDGLAHGL